MPPSAAASTSAGVKPPPMVSTPRPAPIVATAGAGTGLTRKPAPSAQARRASSAVRSVPTPMNVSGRALAQVAERVDPARRRRGQLERGEPLLDRPLGDLEGLGGGLRADDRDDDGGGDRTRGGLGKTGFLHHI